MSQSSAARRKMLLWGCIGSGVAIGLAAFAVAVLSTNPARLAIQTIPEGPFKVTVSKTADGKGITYDGASAIELDPGDYFVDVVPVSKAWQRKRLKVHLGGNQLLPLPVVLIYRPPGQAVAGEKPIPAQSRPEPGEAKVFSATIISDEPGVEITVDGKKHGQTPRVKVETSPSTNRTS